MNNQISFPNFIKDLFNKYPETRVTRIDNLNPISTWKNWKEWKYCNDVDKNEINLRNIFPNEIIIDIDKDVDIENIKLKLLDVFFYLYHTGSRGYHIHLFYSDLTKYDKETRNRIRKMIIREFNADEAKSSESGVIALENTFHFKTGKLKTLLEKREGENIINEIIIKKAEEELKREHELLSKINIKKEDFKDYHLKDKFFSYFKDGNIKDNQYRNNIVFKNIAVALVHEGLNINEIENLITPILKEHYKDKKWGEFRGWVNKALNSDLDYYNIYEINNWAKVYNHPQFYEEIKGVEDIGNLLNIEQLWNAVWDEYITDQPIWRKLCLYNLISTVLNEKDTDDLRIHVIFSSYTSTGKDEGVKLVEKVLLEMGCVAESYSSITDRTLIGAVNNIIKEENNKHGLLIPGDSISIRGKEIFYRNPVEFGILVSHNWIGFPEGETVLSPRNYNQNLQLLLRQAMDKKRTIGKGVGGATIKLHTNTSFLICTYPIPQVITKILDNGLFQRVLYYNAPLTQSLHDNIIEKTLTNINIKSLGANVSVYFSRLIRKLNELKLWWSINKNDLYDEFDNRSIIDYFKEKIFKLDDVYGFLDQDKKNILQAIIRRGVEHMRRLIILNMLISDKKLKKIDVDKAVELFKICLISIKDIFLAHSKRSYVEEEDKRDSNIIAMKNLIKKYGHENKIDLSYFNVLLDEHLNMKSPNTQVKWVKRLINEGLANIVNEKFNKIYIVLKRMEEEIDNFDGHL